MPRSFPVITALLASAMLPACRSAVPGLAFDADHPVGTYEWSSTGAEGEALSGTLIVEGESGALRASLTGPRLPLLDLLERRWTDTLLRGFDGPDGEPIDRTGPWDMAWEGGAPGLNAHMGWDAPRRRIVVVLSNMDPPAASSVGRAILRQGR